MTYTGFLLLFLVIPIVLLYILNRRDRRKAQTVSGRLIAPSSLILALGVIAVIYTTPWDNYLVATSVWWYDPALVMGITLWWVPLEEYCFFVLQTALVGLWFLLLQRRITPPTLFMPQKAVRLIGSVVLGIIWAISAAILLISWEPGRYLALVLVWALPPIAFQVALGGDILWHYRRLVVTVIASMTLYLSTVDIVALHSGTWVINPQLTLGISFVGVLPVEESVFFLVTCSLLTFGLTLGLAPQTLSRLPAGVKHRWSAVDGR